MKLCPKCDGNVLNIFHSLTILNSSRSKIQEDDEYCTYCGMKLVAEILTMCPTCNTPRRHPDITLTSFNLINDPWVRNCAKCGYDFNK